MAKTDFTLSSYDLFLELEAFSEGRSCHAWRCFGSHPAQQDGVDGYRFRVWAPNAKQVCVYGSFNGWDPNAHPLKLLEGGIWRDSFPDSSSTTPTCTPFTTRTAASPER